MNTLHFKAVKGGRLRTYLPMELLVALKEHPLAIEQADVSRLPMSVPIAVTELIEKYLADAVFHKKWACYLKDDLDPMIVDDFETAMAYEYEGQPLFRPYKIHRSEGFFGPSITLIRLLCVEPE